MNISDQRTIEISNAVRHAMHSARQTIERLMREKDRLWEEMKRLAQENTQLRAQVAILRRDLRAPQSNAEFEISADSMPIFLRPQAPDLSTTKED